MTFKSVFYSLQEVFPQIDLRILKAVAMEHTMDVDAAMEFVLSDVLPCIGESKGTSYTFDDTHDTEHSLANARMNKEDSLLGFQGAKENTSLLPELLIVCESAMPDNYTCAVNAESSCMGEAVSKGSLVEHAKLMEDGGDLIFDHTTNASHAKPDSMGEMAMDTSPSNALFHDQLSNAEHGKAVNLVEQIVEPCQHPQRMVTSKNCVGPNLPEL